MFEFAWPWVFLLLPLPWLLRRCLPAVSKPEAELSVPFFNDLHALAMAQQSSVPA